MYHEVYRPEERLRLRRLTNPAYNIELGGFRKQMAFLSENNVATLTIDEILTQDAAPVKKAVSLTFDDGWQGNYYHALPILQEYGFKATFFVATDLIGKPLYMTWEQLKEMQSSGMSMQSHTVSHRPLGAIEDKDILFELSESKKVIEEKLGSVVQHLSLPHGSKEPRIWPIARNAGYRSISTSDVGFARNGSPGPWLKRISIGDGISEQRFRLIGEGQYRAISGMIISKSLKNRSETKCFLFQPSFCPISQHS